MYIFGFVLTLSIIVLWAENLLLFINLQLNFDYMMVYYIIVNNGIWLYLCIENIFVNYGSL